MMSGAFSAPPCAPGPEAVPGKVFRSELNPVDFLRRAAYMYPEKAAVVHGERQYSYRQLAERSWRLANALRSAGLGKGDRVATLLFNSPAMLEAHFGVPAAGGILVAVNHRLASAEIGYILQHSGARYLLLDIGLETLAGPLDLAGVTVIRCVDTGSPEDPYEEFLAGASPARPVSWLEHEEETISVNYTSGTTGRPKGGAVHLPRCVPERAERGDHRRDGTRFGVPVDAADVPLQWLVLPVGGHRGAGAARDHAGGGPAARLGADRR
jgi:acyl-coenzyme A synthetase/AMP-(fatty) acid ligase